MFKTGDFADYYANHGAVITGESYFSNSIMAKGGSAGTLHAINDSRGTTTAIRTADGKLVKEVMYNGEKWRRNPVYKTYNSIKGNKILWNPDDDGLELWGAKKDWVLTVFDSKDKRIGGREYKDMTYDEAFNLFAPHLEKKNIARYELKPKYQYGVK